MNERKHPHIAKVGLPSSSSSSGGEGLRLGGVCTTTGMNGERERLLGARRRRGRGGEGERDLDRRGGAECDLDRDLSLDGDLNGGGRKPESSK